jgi:hypothetical protein
MSLVRYLAPEINTIIHRIPSPCFQKMGCCEFRPVLSFYASIRSELMPLATSWIQSFKEFNSKVCVLSLIISLFHNIRTPRLLHN